MQAKSLDKIHPSVPGFSPTQNVAQDTEAAPSSERFPQVNLSPKPFPDPWLFDSEALLRELDRCREKVLEIPVDTHAGYFASTIAINSIWQLRETLRELLALHRQGQRAFASAIQDASRANEESNHRQTQLRGKAELRASTNYIVPGRMANETRRHSTRKHSRKAAA